MVACAAAVHAWTAGAPLSGRAVGQTAACRLAALRMDETGEAGFAPAVGTFLPGPPQDPQPRALPRTNPRPIAQVNLQTVAPGCSPCTIKVIGVGGGGGNTLNRMVQVRREVPRSPGSRQPHSPRAAAAYRFAHAAPPFSPSPRPRGEPTPHTRSRGVATPPPGGLSRPPRSPGVARPQAGPAMHACVPLHGCPHPCACAWQEGPGVERSTFLEYVACNTDMQVR